MSYRLPEIIAAKLLDGLSSDDAFRAKFAGDPRQVLADLGFAPAGDASIQGGIWSCLIVQELASKEVIRSARAEVMAQISAKNCAYNPISLDQAPAAKRAA